MLTWCEPRRIRRDDDRYFQRHWLVDGAGQIRARLDEPPRDNPEDSFEAALHFRTIDDWGFFISLEDAQRWCFKEAEAHLDALAKISAAKVLATSGGTGGTVEAPGEIVHKESER